MCPLSVPLALCSTRNQKEYDYPPRSDPPNRTMGPSTPPCSSHYWAGLWPWVTCQREVGASACQWTVARGVREFWVMSEKRVWTCVYGLRKELVSWFLVHLFVCPQLMWDRTCVTCVFRILYVNAKEPGCVFLWGRFSSFRGETVWPARLSLVTKCKSPLEIEFALSS